MESTNPIHRPCPDLPAYSLSQEQKAKGLEMLKQVKAQVRDGVLNKLRTQYEETESPTLKTAISRRARSIKRNWS
ncbi:hypothetical protein J0692_04835 [Vibrio alginolyticus]|uniref:hypothetical protein n=1 Tax=Vibrio alginolyticus TaxID=663 RepID=UPI001A8DA191|nr:hypothetical protein [Vibrio alginolyticus]MBO0161553.1 hypothetical protein [Vibrio alginolyticus]